MRILLARTALAAVMCAGLASISAGQQPGSSRPFDAVITRHEVMPYQHFEQAVLEAASQTGISAETTDHILQEFAAANRVRVVPVAEWRAFLLESLCGDNIPCGVAKSFLRSLRGKAWLPVDTGFLEAVRTVDLGDKSIYQVGQDAGLTPARAVSQPLPPYPNAARALGIEGFTLLKCVVLEDGSVTNCRLEHAAGFGIDESALLTVQDKWKFEPARLNGQPVALQATIEISMRLF